MAAFALRTSPRKWLSTMRATRGLRCSRRAFGERISQHAVDQHRRPCGTTAGPGIPRRGAGCPATEVRQRRITGRHPPVFARGAEVDENGRLQTFHRKGRAAQPFPEHVPRSLHRGRCRAIAVVGQIALQRGGTGQGQEQIAVEVQGRRWPRSHPQARETSLWVTAASSHTRPVSICTVPSAWMPSTVRSARLGSCRRRACAGRPARGWPPLAAHVDAVIQPHLGRGRGRHTDDAAAAGTRAGDDRRSAGHRRTRSARRAAVASPAR